VLEDESFVTYEGSGENSEVSIVVDIETWEQPRRGLLHARGMGAGASNTGGDLIWQDAVDSTRNLELIRAMALDDSNSSETEEKTSRHAKKPFYKGHVSSVGSSTSSTVSPQSQQPLRKPLPAATWDHHGRRVQKLPSNLIPLISKKAGCEYTVAARAIQDPSQSCFSGSSFSSSSMRSKAATRYGDFDGDSTVISASTSSHNEESNDSLLSAEGGEPPDIQQDESSTSLSVASSSDNEFKGRLTSAMKLADSVIRKAKLRR
jgi:hypothetical protein